jgi:hypothetical protein
MSKHRQPLVPDPTAPPYPAAAPAPRAGRLVHDLPSARAARMIFCRWLALRRRGVALGLPLTDPLPGPYGSWYRVYRSGRIYWHPDASFDIRLGAFVYAPLPDADGEAGA